MSSYTPLPRHTSYHPSRGGSVGMVLIVLLVLAVAVGGFMAGWSFITGSPLPGRSAEAGTKSPTAPSVNQGNTTTDSKGTTTGDQQTAGTIAPTGPKRIEVEVDQKAATAIVSEYVGDTKVASFQARSGGPGAETPSGSYAITGHLGTIHTALYQATLGNEFYLKYFLQFQGDYGFHTFKVNDKTMQTEIDATHGCVAMAEADAKTLYDWAPDGTPVHITAH